MTAIAQQLDAREVDSPWAAFQSRVEAARHRYDELDLPTHLYALVDTRGLPDLREALERLDSIPFAALWDGTDLSAFKDIAPLLIKIDLGATDADMPRQLLKRLWRFSDERLMVTWIWTPHGLEELADHFRGYCEYTLPDRRAFYLHFYDNRILERLRLTWTQDEWTRFASVAFEIWYRNRSGEDSAWSGDTLSQPSGAAPLQLSDEQQLRLHTLGYADKVAMQLTEVYGVLLEHLSSDALYLAVHTQVERARRHGVRDELDMLWYVAKGLLVSPQFDEHPLIHPKLLAASHGRISFSEALSLVGDACREESRKVETI